MDPELYELTTAKLDAGAPSSRVADAFARLMSTMEKTSTATRSEGALQHIEGKKKKKQPFTRIRLGLSQLSLWSRLFSAVLSHFLFPTGSPGKRST